MKTLVLAFYEDAGLAFVRVAGPVCVADVEGVRGDLRARFGDRSDWRLLADVRGIEIDFHFEAVSAIGASRIRGLGGMAVVVGSPSHYGVLRQYAALVSPDFEVGVFYDLEEACRWLDLDSATVGALNREPRVDDPG